LRLKSAKSDFRHGLADRLAAARKARKDRRADQLARGLTTAKILEEDIAELRAKIAARSVDGLGIAYAGCDELGNRLFVANMRALHRLEERLNCETGDTG
jgi:hypothetical protein